MRDSNGITRPINWNNIPDPVDKQVWDKLTENFWLDTKIALSNDIKSWDTLDDRTKDVVVKVFIGLTALDTLQGNVGAPALMQDAQTPHEEAVLANITFVEQVHAKSYSSIFSTLCTSDQIEDAFRWAESDEHLLKKAEIVTKYYDGSNPHKKKIASTLLESFLFYSGFYMPLYLSSRATLTNTSDLIKLIIRDEQLHGYYIGYKYQQGIKNLPDYEKDDLLNFTIDLLLELMDNESKYTENVYGDLGLADDVKKFLKYNANKALMNLGYDPLYSSSQTNASPAVITALSGSDNHDFFSGAGNSYKIAQTEDMGEDDWDF